MESITDYTDLIAWQKAMELCRSIYDATAGFPANEQFGLTQQLRRAAASIPANIAEGWGRGTTADYVRFLRNARGSLYEMQTFIRLAADFQYIQTVPAAALHSACDECSRVLNGLIRSVQKNPQ